MSYTKTRKVKVCKGAEVSCILRSLYFERAMRKATMKVGEKWQCGWSVPLNNKVSICSSKTRPMGCSLDEEKYNSLPVIKLTIHYKTTREKKK